MKNFQRLIFRGVVFIKILNKYHVQLLKYIDNLFIGTYICKIILKYINIFFYLFALSCFSVQSYLQEKIFEEDFKYHHQSIQFLADTLKNSLDRCPGLSLSPLPFIGDQYTYTLDTLLDLQAQLKPITRAHHTLY